MNVYPTEYYLELTGDANMLGRITLSKLKEAFCVEVDIVFVESKKIFIHVGSFYNIEDHQEARDFGVMKLSAFLSNVRK